MDRTCVCGHTYLVHDDNPHAYCSVFSCTCEGFELEVMSCNESGEETI